MCVFYCFFFIECLCWLCNCRSGWLLTFASHKQLERYWWEWMCNFEGRHKVLYWCYCNSSSLLAPSNNPSTSIICFSSLSKIGLLSPRPRAGRWLLFGMACVRRSIHRILKHVETSNDQCGRDHWMWE